MEPRHVCVNIFITQLIKAHGKVRARECIRKIIFISVPCCKDGQKMSFKTVIKWVEEFGMRRSATLFQKKLHHSCFPVNITKFLRTAFCIQHLRWLLLKIVEKFLRNSNLIRGICTEEFIRNSSLCFNNLKNGFVPKNLKKF